MTYEYASKKFLLLVGVAYWDMSIDEEDFEGVCQQAYAIVFGYGLGILLNRRIVKCV